MNNRSVALLWLGALAVVLMGCYPPWLVYEAGVTTWDNKRTEGFTAVFYHGYEPLLWKPAQGTAVIDLSRLAVQWAIVGALTLAGVVTLNRKRAGS